jgi:hypothetical protein
MAADEHPAGLSTREAAAAVGVSSRQLTHWAKRGYITGLRPQGSGYPLRWAPGHIREAQLVKARFDLVRQLTMAPPAQQKGERLTA